VAIELLKSRGLTPDKSKGQHFLVDPNTAKKIVRLASIEPGMDVVEIGPGVGALTEALIDSGARVVAVEIDAAIASLLSDLNVEVIVADATKVDFDEVCKGPTSLVSNLPYNIATHLMLKILSEATSITKGVCMVQREVAQRWVAQVGDKQRSGSSLKFQYFARPQIVGIVNPTVFLPPPKVTSALVRFERVRAPEAPSVVDSTRRGHDKLFRLITAAFAHRRKMMVNSLADEGFDPDVARVAITNVGHVPSVRATELTLDDFIALNESVGEPSHRKS